MSCEGWGCNPDSPCCFELKQIKEAEEKKYAKMTEEAKQRGPPIFVTMDMTTIVTVELQGTDGSTKQFPIHKDLLCSNSKFFNAALNGGFSEAQSGNVAINDTTEATFSLFMQWLYTGDFAHSGLANYTDYSVQDLLDLYIFADFHDVALLRTLVLERCSRMNHGWTPHAVNKAYDRLPESSDFSAVMVQQALWNWDPVCFEKDKDLYPRQFVWDVMAESLRNREVWRKPW